MVVMMYVKYPLSLRNVKDLLHERGIDICHETVRVLSRQRSESTGSPFIKSIRAKEQGSAAATVLVLPQNAMTAASSTEVTLARP